MVKMNRIAKDSLGRRKLFFWLQAAGIFLWLSNLLYTDAYFSVYVLTALTGFYCLCANQKEDMVLQKKVTRSALALGVLFSFLVTSANYAVFERLRDPALVSEESNQLMNWLELAAVFLGGIPIGYHCLKQLYILCTKPEVSIFRRVSGNRPTRFFLLTFAFITAVDLIYLFTTVYPGSVSHDSMRQIQQVYTGVYNNVLPYWYTRFIGLLLSTGYGIFHDINKAVAFYSCGQILIMAAIFSYTLTTLYQRRCSRAVLAAVFAFYALMPYNMAFAASMWKDVMFTGAVLLTITAQYRILKDLGRKCGNRICLLLGGIGACLMRTNGWYVMLVSLAVLLLCGKEIRRKLAVAMTVVVAVGFFMNIPMMKILHVPGLDMVESLSMPLQQIGRVLSEQRQVPEADREFLDQILDVDAVPESYEDWTSDPMKILVWEGDPGYLFSHRSQFISTWLRLGARYPMDYFKAWVDETKGYWNAGYDYYIYAEYVADNEFGIQMDLMPNPVKSLFKAYFAFSRESLLFEPLLSVGLNVWIAGALLWLCIVKKRREAVLFIPLFVILAGLWAGSPVFCEFRYAYPVTAAVPFLVPVCLSRDK